MTMSGPPFPKCGISTIFFLLFLTGSLTTSHILNIFLLTVRVTKSEEAQYDPGHQDAYVTGFDIFYIS